ncbi:MAG: hypothetical protein HKN37_13520 [Rhodothermales bacterium]|nr:hypothetical protein [Rhodothermales bacterium]
MAEPMDETWTSMHDMAIIYIACMHGGDGEIDRIEEERILELLHARYPDLDDADVGRIMQRALLAYLGSAGSDLLTASIHAAGEELSPAERVHVVRDLSDIASADGLIFPGEAGFISTVARLWGVKNHPSGD